MQEAVSEKTEIVYYSCFNILNSKQSQILCNYKYLIQEIIMKLGQDWRIESNLLAEQIILLRNIKNEDYSIFNEFLSNYLKGKIGLESQFCNYSEKQVQEQFIDTLTNSFSQEPKITQSLTFKTLSLGYTITATEVWKKIFQNYDPKIHKKMQLKPFSKLVQSKNQKAQNQGKFQMKSSYQASSLRKKIEKFDIGSSHFSFSEQQKQAQDHYKWQKIEGDFLNEEQLSKIKRILGQKKHRLEKSHVLNQFVCFVDEVNFKKLNKTVRVFTLSNEFYVMAFIVWLIFSVKMFFSMNYGDYQKYFKEQIGQQWKDQLQRPLKKFQMIVEKEWNKLLKDYTVALHDDIEVLNILIDRVRKDLKQEWQQRLESLQQIINK